MGISAAFESWQSRGGHCHISTERYIHHHSPLFIQNEGIYIFLVFATNVTGSSSLVSQPCCTTFNPLKTTIFVFSAFQERAVPLRSWDQYGLCVRLGAVRSIRKCPSTKNPLFERRREHLLSRRPECAWHQPTWPGQSGFRDLFGFEFEFCRCQLR